MEQLLVIVAVYSVYYTVAVVIKKGEPVKSAAKGMAFTLAGLFAIGFVIGFVGALNI